MCRWCWSGRSSPPLPCNILRFASSSSAGSELPAPRPFDTIGFGRRDALYRRPSYPGSQNHSGFANKQREETLMAVDGNWNIVMSTPMGERNATLTVKSAGGTLTGTQGAEGQSGEIFDGTVSGDDVAWKIRSEERRGV